jgi:hypothetical protein
MTQHSSLPDDIPDFFEGRSPLDILKGMEVVPLQPCESYPSAGIGIGASTMGFMMGRDRYVAEHGFVLLTAECVDALAILLAGKSVLEVGAGTGFLSHCLVEKGVSVLAQDMASPGESSPYRFQKKWKLDHVGPFEEVLTDKFDVVLLSWPCMGSDFAFNVAKSMVKGQVLVYQGEGPGGCTASDEFFDYVDGADWAFQEGATELLNQHHRRFPAIHDRWLVFKKK